MIVLRELAPAKINLYLHVTGKRADGRHQLDSLVVFADAADKLEVLPAEDIALTMEGPYADKLSAGKDNLVVKAAQMLRKHIKSAPGAAIVLHKNLPVGAGIGGGSADAAATLKLLARFWRVKPTPKDLHAMAVSLGADVAACLRSQSLYMGGAGETIEPGPVVSGVYTVLANPGKTLLTEKVFAEFKGSFSTASRRPNDFASSDALVQFLQKTRNDLEGPAIKLMPDIKTVLAVLQEQKDCLLARMSGSGPTCFGLYSSQQSADAAVQHISAKHPTWWVKAANVR